MNQFTTKFAQHIAGTISGFDRLVFRGNIRRLCFPEGMRAYLNKADVLLKDAGQYFQEFTNRVKEASLAPAQAQGQTIEFLRSPSISKEDRARQIATQHDLQQGNICVLSATEPCQSFEIYRNRDAKKLELVSRYRKCLHLYHYAYHPVFGFMHVRLQTWFPFQIQVCLNGREWLARQLDQAQIGYQRADNCFPWLQDYEQAQKFLQEQVQAPWPELLAQLALVVNPLTHEICQDFSPGYEWSCYQSEWATDCVFQNPSVLRALYPRLLQHGMSTFGSPDVLRFLGRKTPLSAKINPRFLGEVSSDVKSRAEGVRIKHRLEANSVKMYDKAFTDTAGVLRVETTIHEAEAFRVLRAKTGGKSEDLAVRDLRRGLEDLPLRAQVSQECNERYLDAQASVDNTQLLSALLDKVTAPVTYNGKRVRALRPFEAEEMKLLELVGRGEFTLQGMRNRDLQSLYFGERASSEEEACRRSGFMTRKLRLLRAHGIVSKIAGTHRYEVTSEGRKILTALLAARQTPVNQLLARAA